mmetsp:Transcript_51106/g.95216  ORF Transcript_51106/g.95216 Transcript_51106/m.95216 type:complete len:147 (-) Transcript_51106:128-568(-)
MPLYDLMYMIHPAATRQEVVNIVKRTGEYVSRSGGVVTAVTSYGTRDLAYKFKLKGESSYSSRAHVMQLSFLVGPKTLDELRHQVQVDENVMRHLFYKTESKPSLRKLKKEERWTPVTPVFPRPFAASALPTFPTEAPGFPILSEQ